MALVELESPAVSQTLPRSPAAPSLVYDLVTTVDHKKIGLMYIALALMFLVIGGCEALAMRWQLLFPRYDFIGPDAFNQLFTMHGTTMVFFMGMPILIGIGNYMVPLSIGARD
ncbi:MAG TPA: cbb3-type cytochrome c oxidase subunit I, partial [Pirellulales bacterium]|nr:cbb3-type cytochrome c oxidase subunit I [Pirellulales bacterium]